jgi:hypothetical protein
VPPRRRRAFALVAGSLRYLAERDNQVVQRAPRKARGFSTSYRLPTKYAVTLTRDAAQPDRRVTARNRLEWRTLDFRDS